MIKTTAIERAITAAGKGLTRAMQAIAKVNATQAKADGKPARVPRGTKAEAVKMTAAEKRAAKAAAEAKVERAEARAAKKAGAPAKKTTAAAKKAAKAEKAAPAKKAKRSNDFPDV